MQHSAVRKIHFCAGHRVMNHESKCANLHGHNYILWVYAKPKVGLDTLGRVIDFSVLKEILGEWIDEHWDHTTVLCKDDWQIIDFLNNFEPQNKPPYQMPYNPTAENMARYLLESICPELFKYSDVDIFKIEIYETENCKVVSTW